MKYRNKCAELLKQGKNVALYCSGLYSDTNILYIDRFFGVRPTIVIDNDPQKSGETLLGVPVITYAAAKEKYNDLYYWIQGNTYQYAVIGDLLADGVSPDHIINYVPVEKRKGCLISETSIGISGNSCNVCYETGFNYNKNHNSINFDKLDIHGFNSRFSEFRKAPYINPDGSDCRENCRLFKYGYFAVEPKIRLIGNYNTDRCELACVYCFLQELGMDKTKDKRTFSEWLNVLLGSDMISDALVLHLCPTEKTVDTDIDRSLEICNEHIDAFETIHLFSCCWAYRKGMEPLLEKGTAKNYWSLDAGTEDTWEKIKRRKGGFSKVLENVEHYCEHDAFKGASLVPKYSIVKGLNDNEKDFEGFVKLCKRFGVRYCGIQWDYADNENTNEEDFAVIRSFADMIKDSGLKTTYTSGSTVLSKALGSLAFYEEKKGEMK